MGVATRIKRAKGGGLNQILWSPDSQKVFAASVESVFRVWETQNWTCEKWTNFCGRCKVKITKGYYYKFIAYKNIVFSSGGKVMM